MLRIVDWELHFENNRTKELKKLAWVPFPNRHDGDGYTELLDHPNGAAHYGAWCALVQVASKCDPRGTLSRDGARPHTAASLARMTKIPETIMGEAINRLLQPIKWLEIIPDPPSIEGVVEMSQEGATSSHLPASRVRAREWNGMERNGKEENGTSICSEPAKPTAEPQIETEQATVSVTHGASQSRPRRKPTDDSPVVMVLSCNGGVKEWPLTEAKMAEYRGSFPGVDVLSECRKARQWCFDNPSKRKTFNGMAAFLGRWLSKAQDRSGTKEPTTMPKRTEKNVAAARSFLGSEDYQCK